jgi:hypothetical protein
VARHLKRAADIGLAAINVEGGLISPEKLAQIAATTPDAKAAADYHCPKGTSLRDEITRYFRIGQAHWQAWSRIDRPTVTQTAAFAKTLLQVAFGFEALKGSADHIVDGHHYRIVWEAKGGRVPIVVAAPIGTENGKTVDAFTKALPEFGDGDSEGLARRSPIALLQDWLNTSHDSIWGLVFAGDRVRLMRDNASFTRPAYIEADLGAIFHDEMFGDFTAIWLLIHATRFGAEGAPAGDSPLERWREAGQRAGTAARERLCGSVEDTLMALGQGFLDANPDLRAKLDDQSLSMTAWFEQLLRVVYRLIFLAVAEDRDLLLSPGTSPAVRALYLDGYGFAHLRDRSVRRSAHDHHFDAWEGAKIVFRALECGEKLLGLSALGGVFARGLTPNLDDAKLPNRAFMTAIFKLSWLMDDNHRVRINWRDMATEELGSVYEGLLELVPVREDHGRTFTFAGGAEAKGNARKISGSYYTPDSLVQTLLDSALDPVLDRAEAEGGADAILSLSVIDPACGSGHFLLGAARRMATRVAQVRDNDAPDYPAAMRDVARNCIHGVDRNPMAVELTKVALWIETVEPGKPLGFLDANIRCGDSLLGVFDLKVLEAGIPDAAYKPLSGDDKETAKHFAKRNRAEREGQGSFDFGRGGGRLPPALPMADEARALRVMPEDSPEEIAAKRKRFEAARSEPQRRNLRIAADLYVAAFLAPKIISVPANRDTMTIPTTAHVWEALAGHAIDGSMVGRAQNLTDKARAFHWPLEFSDVIAGGGFDVVLGNPPWERIKVQEQEFFALREPEVAEAPTAAARSRLIAKLKNSSPGSHARSLFDEFETAKRVAESSSIFARESGRFPLTGTGDVNTYGLFSELFKDTLSRRGRAGIIVPTEILSGDALKSFFQDIIDRGILKSSIGFENEEFIFPGIANVNRFALITLGSPDPQLDQFKFAFYLRRSEQLFEKERFVDLSKADLLLLNPNTRTCPIFRAKFDADLTRKIYARVPVLIDEATGTEGNPWGITFMAMHHMANDSDLFRSETQLLEANCIRSAHRWTAENGSENYVPLYEGKFIWHFDHRFSSYHNLGKVKGRGGRGLPPVTLDEYQNADFEVEPRHWVAQSEVDKRLGPLGWSHNWLVGWRDVTSAKLERTFVTSVIPRVAVGHKLPLYFMSTEPKLSSALIANLSSIVFDYFVRLKMGGTSLIQSYFKQFPVLPPSTYGKGELAFIVPRVLELTYTSHSIAPFAHDLGYDGPPFIWDEDRRAQLRAELDAWYARAYGLTRDELRYVLDPKEVMGAEYPSETFRVLQKNEIAKYGEYRAARLVLAAYDQLVSDDMRSRTEGYR